MADETTATVTVETPQTQTEPGGQTGGKAPESGPSAPQNGAGGAFTQEDVNRFLAAERRKWQESEELKALRAKAKKADELEEASKSDLEKLTERATAAEQLAAQRAERYRQALIRSQFTVQAAAAGIPADRIDAAFRLADLSVVAVDEEADSVTGMDKAIESLPEFVKAPIRPAVPDINSGGGNGQQVDPAARLSEIKQRFRLGD